MKQKPTVLLVALFFLLSSAVVAYGRCAQAAHQVDADTEHQTSLIHCPESVPNYSERISLLGRGQSDSGKALLSSATSFKTIGIAYFKESTFSEIFSQQDLYQLEEVYRL